MSESLKIPFDEKTISCLLDQSDKSKCLILLAHGAGAGMEHPFMDQLSKALGDRNVATLRFNFPYMDAGRKSPGGPKPNIAAWKAVLEYAISNFHYPIFLSGKSYGGRMASHLLTEVEFDPVKGIIYYGFPLHAPGRDSKDRAAHLENIKVPQLFLQGTKDALANAVLIGEVSKSLAKSRLEMIEGGDHSFKVKGTKHSEVILSLAGHTSNWVDSTLN